ncbi:MAG: DUF2341 domain-containing protein, partial [bacterium]|nr:DUF2341 domain-containing protein [bacterium]
MLIKLWNTYIDMIEHILVSTYSSFVKRPILMMGTLILVILIPIVFLVVKYSNKSVEAAWYDDTFAYRKSIDVTNNTSAEANIYIGVTADTSDTTRFQADCGDLRFTKFNGEKLPYYISSGCGTSSTILHVFLNSFPAGKQTIYYYYGNANAPNGFNSSDFATQASNYTLGSTGSEEKTVGPVAYWKFDEGVGSTVYDSSGQNNRGSLGTGSSAPTWKSEDMCISGKCLYFDGTSDEINIGNTALLGSGSTSFTVQTWIRTSQTSGVGSIFGQYDAAGDTNHYFRLANGLIGADEYLPSGGAISGSKNIADNKWHFVQFIRSGTQWYIYTDGLLENSGASEDYSGGAPTAVWIGDRYAPAGAYDLNGYLDEFKIYNYSRTAAQIKADYAAGLARSSSVKGVSASLGSNPKSSAALSDGLVGYWKMDESIWSGTAGEVLDSSGNGNNGIGYSGATTANGKFGNGGSFNSSDTNDYVDAGSGASLAPSTNRLTVSTWVY